MLGFKPRLYVTHQWALVALLALAVFLVALALPTPIGAPLALLALAVYAQFMYAAGKHGCPWDEPFLVRWYGDTMQWWQRFSKPLEVGFYAGQAVYVRETNFETFREFYNLDGYYIGCEQYINWSYTDPDWKPGDPDDVTIEFRPYRGDTPERMSWLARWRSPKNPKYFDEHDRLHPYCSVLNMRSEGYVTNLILRNAA